jgi:ABC transporter substrate binding protein
LRPVDMRNADEIERGVFAFSRSPAGGMIVTGSVLATFHRDLIISLAARYRLPAVHEARVFVEAGGLISYGASRLEQFRQAASYVNRIFKGEKPADLRCKRRPSTSWQSTSRLLMLSASLCQQRCSRVLMRSSNEAALIGTAMKAIVIHEFGDPNVLKLEDVARPTLEAGEIAIRVRAATVNQTLDVALRAGKYARRPPLPHIPGSDAAGEVAAVARM